MNHHAKAASAGSTQASGDSRSLFGRAFATRDSSSDAKGSGVPSRRPSARLRGTLAVLALAIAAFAITAAPASAAPPSPIMDGVSGVSYTSAHVTGRVTTPAEGPFLPWTFYTFQYSTDGTNWIDGPGATIVGPATNKRVSGDLSGLKGGTKYFARLTANYLGGPVDEVKSPGPNPEFTTLAVDPPENVSIDAPAELFSLTAKLSGKVKRPSNPDQAFNVQCRFEYIDDAQFQLTGFDGATKVPCSPNPLTEAGVEKVVTAKISGLTAATTYHQRLVAENGSPQVIATASSTFTTAPTVEKPKVLSIDDPADVSYNTAKLSGEVERPAGADPALDVVCYFEVVSDAQFKETEFEGAGRYRCDQNPEKGGGYALIANPGPTVVTKTVKVQSGVTYHYRLTAENAAGADTKTTASTFTTLLGGDPTFTLDPDATVAGYTSLEFSGTVTRGLGADAENEQLAAYFEFAEVGTEDWRGCCTSFTFIPKGSGAFNFSQERTGLKPSTEYEYRLNLGRNGFSYEYTPPPYPTVTTRPLATPTATLDPVTNVTGTGAHFSATVDTNAPAGPLDALGKAAYKTKWHFECIPGCPDPNGNPFSGTVEGEEGSKAISLDLEELRANVYYEVKLVAENSYWTEESDARFFQTPLILADVKSTPGAPDGNSGYTLEGIVNSNNSKVNCQFEYGTTATYPNTYKFPCLPSPSGPDEVQKVNVDATEGQFKLSFRGQTTPDLAYDASPATVASALKALPGIGATGVAVSGTPGSYEVKFGGSLAGSNIEPLKAQDGTTPLGGGGGVSITTATEGGRDGAVSVEAKLEGLTVGATYHFRIFATNAAGTASSPDRTFIPTLTPKETCANEQLRQENSSLALPECRAYEMVSPAVGKEGFDARLADYVGGNRVRYVSGAGNIARSGQNSPNNLYVTNRTAAGWETIPNLNGSSGSIYDAPAEFQELSWLKEFYRPSFYSPDLLSSLWRAHRKNGPVDWNLYLRSPDGTFAFVGSAKGPKFDATLFFAAPFTPSADLSHVITWARVDSLPSEWGPGVYEYVGTGMAQPRRVDLDNAGSPISTCTDASFAGYQNSNAIANKISAEGRVIVLTVFGGCGGANPPADELWARVNGTTAFDVSASRCDRVAPAPACNAPAKPTFAASTPDGSRVFFTTTQQLVNADTDQTKDIYACDIPSGSPAPSAGKANHCSAFMQVSGAQTDADVESFLTTSEDGATVLFSAKGVLADNEDARGEEALAGNHNLYAWRTDAAHPTGQTTFLGSLGANDIAGAGSTPQSTPDGRYLVFTTATQLLETDTDSARDVYRYDADTGELIRVSTNVLGVGGNGNFDAEIARATEHHPTTTISDDGQRIVFASDEPLFAADGNGERDVYLWTPAGVSLISPGSVGGGVISGFASIPFSMDGSGQNVYFATGGALAPADGDDLADVYDARVGGGFSFAEAAPCSGAGGACQPSSPGPAPAPAPLTAQSPADPGNVKPKSCPKGKVAKGDKCVKKKKPKKHSGKKHGKKAAHKQGGGK